uniref:Laminin G domain-containing protein n=1 Tax=Strigops habroptila TaxID=2489341 RepID=A0A672U2K5_STRHB
MGRHPEPYGGAPRALWGGTQMPMGSLGGPCSPPSWGCWGGGAFGGAPGQWARYGRWAPGAGGQLSFSLKTNISRALLLYLDDGGNCDFLELLVAEGRLRLRFAIACAEPATVQPPPVVSDGRWHMVLLTRNARETALAVDGDARAGAVRSKRAEMLVASDLFVGGIPPDVRLSALTLSTVKYEAPFRGWVANLKVGDVPAALLGAHGVRGEGQERCARHPPCAHGGRCTLRRGEPHCDCAGTGHRGVGHCLHGIGPCCHCVGHLHGIDVFVVLTSHGIGHLLHGIERLHGVRHLHGVDVFMALDSSMVWVMS